MSSLLSLSNLQTYFRTDRGTVKAIDGLDLTIREGETVGLVGESGSGKSVTALSAMQLVDHPGEVVGGSIEFRDDDVASNLLKQYPDRGPEFVDSESGIVELTETPDAAMRQLRGREMSMIFQDPMTSLNPAATVGNQVAESLLLHQYDRKRPDTWWNAVREITPSLGRDPIEEQALSDAVDMLEQVGIPEAKSRIDQYPHEFSGGMRQRVLIAIALACQPKLLIADEPTTALDVTIQAQILELINDLQEQLGMAVLFITHDLGVVAETCDRVAVMYAGEIVEEGPVEEVFTNPSHPYTYTLLESIPTEDRDRLTPIEGNVPDLIDLPDGCHFAPRCPWSQPECTDEEIPYLQHGSEDINHRSKCIHSEFDESVYADEREGINTKNDGSFDETLVSVNEVKRHFSQADGMLDRWLADELPPVKAVDGVSFDIYQGETLGLVGESGCGKSTTGRTLLRLLEPTDGNVVFSGVDLNDLSENALRETRKEMQMIFQDPMSSLDPRMTVAQTIAEPLKIHDLPVPVEGDDRSQRERRRDRVDELLDAVGLDSSQRDRYPHEMSGGQRQRVGIARSLAVDPDFIVADEPVSALDVSVQAQIINLLEDLQEEFDLTYLFIAHDLSVVRHIADRVAVMYLGEIVELAETEELFEAPKHPYTETLLSAVPEPDPYASGDRIILEGDVPSPIDPPSGCRFRTRCPKVVPPDDLDIEQAAYREVMSFREQIEKETLTIDRFDGEDGEPATPEAVADGGSQRSGQDIVDEFFDESLSPDVEVTLVNAASRLTGGEWDEAASLLRDEFESVCERRSPVLDGNRHLSACHITDSNAR
ncbi:peptide ABC transporter ATP-binding protein (plasmid) [Halostagnicola larsenii XH-48]|uniref:Nickel import system ATP-binding protein NikD n=1 Tax=Halostagnicola larsenii XH-48 TaxID=797299 RepID=W0JTC3_9EURY|nr:ABC transporter ATP-binding protein [Halostagnicola larsenii]AHG01809.1 peptide ABC transporter ATP-binding protein [Halostagnicola larsenii XH-48]